MIYADWEIRELYTEARDKKEEVKILAQMCMVSRAEMVEKLRSLGLQVGGNETKTISRMHWTADKIQAVKILRRAGKKYSQIAAEIGTTENAIKALYNQLRKKGESEC